MHFGDEPHGLKSPFSTSHGPLQLVNSFSFPHSD
jgi:hypothetical protein